MSSTAPSKEPILLVSGPANSLDPLLAILTEGGHALDTVSGVESALAKIDQAPPALILVNARDADAGAPDLCAKLRASQRTCDIPVIFVNPKDRAAVFAAGGADHVSEPFLASEVLARVEIQLAITRSRHLLSGKEQELQREREARRVTERDLTLVEEQGLSLVSSLNEVIYTTDSEGRYTYISPSIERFLGYQPSEVVGQALGVLLHLDDRARQAVQFQRVLAGNEVSNEYQVLTKSGEVRWMRTSSQPVRDGARVVGMQGVLADITDHKEAEAQARQQNEFLRTVLESLTHPFYVVDVHDYSIQLANSAAGFRGKAGLSTCHALTHNLPEPCTSADHPCPIEEIRRTQRPVTVEHVHFDANGEARYAEVHGYPLVDDHDQVVRIIEYSLDVTERKHAEEALRQSEKRYRQLLDALQEGIWVIDDGACTTFVNPRMAEMLGYGVEEMEGRHLFSFMDERGIEISKLNLERRQQGIREQHDFEFLRKDGTRIYTSMETSPIYGEREQYAGAIAAVQDITERRREQEALRRSESLLRETQQLAKVGGWELDLDSQEVIWTEEVYHIHEVPPGFEPNLENALDFYHPEDRSLLEQAIAQAGETGTPWDLELRFVTARGNSLWVRAIGRAERQGGIVTRLSGTFQDITERVEAEQSLREAMETAQQARQLEEARRQEAEQRRLVAESLAGIVAALNSNEPLPEVLDQIATQAHELLESQAVAIYQHEQRADTLSLQASRGLPDGNANPQLMPEAEQAVRQALATRQRVVMDQLAHAPATQAEAGSQAGPSVPLQTSLAVPVIIKDEAYGGIVMCRAGVTPFSDEEIKLATIFANQVALAVESARMREQAERTAAAAERSRLARDLHDSVTQGLFSASLMAEVLPQVWQRDPIAAQEGLEELRLLTRAALAEMRTLLLELRPTALIETKLESLLEQLITATTGRAQIEVRKEIEPIPTLPPEVHVTFYRVAQEALHNVVKHAGSRQLVVSLRPSPPMPVDGSETWRGQVILQVCDDGQGFDPAGTEPEQMGLAIMQERAQAVGARLSIQSHPQDGTQVTLAWHTDSSDSGSEPRAATHM